MAADEKIRLAVGVEADSMEVQRRLVAAGLGFAVLPGIAVAADVRRGRLAGAPLLDAGLRRRLLIALPGIRRLGDAVRGVAAILVEEMQDAVAGGRWPSATWLADAHRPVAKLP